MWGVGVGGRQVWVAQPEPQMLNSFWPSLENLAEDFRVLWGGLGRGETEVFISPSPPVCPAGALCWQ